MTDGAEGPGGQSRQVDANRGGGASDRLRRNLLGRVGAHPEPARDQAVDNGRVSAGRGTTIRRKKDGALFRYCDRVGGADVIGQLHDGTLVGASTPKELMLSPAPLRREPPLPMVIAPLIA